MPEIGERVPREIAFQVALGVALGKQGHEALGEL
jgi:hypothetical protein